MAADSGRLREACDLAHTGSERAVGYKLSRGKRASIGTLARRPCPQVSQWHPRVAKRSSDWSSARGPLPQMPQWHPRAAKRSSDRFSARRPRPQVLQRHPRVAKRALIDTLARGPSTEALLGQGRVPKGRESVPLTGLRSGSRPGLARHSRLQVVLRQDRVAKRASIGTSARGPCPQAPRWHPRVAKGASISTLAR